MQMPRSETELPHALPSHTCRERCCIGHRERMGNRQVGRLVTSMGGQTKVFPIDFALEGPSIGSRTAWDPT